METCRSWCQVDRIEEPKTCDGFCLRVIEKERSRIAKRDLLVVPYVFRIFNKSLVEVEIPLITLSVLEEVDCGL